ncbi:RNA polymerase factor sigma-54 [Campylobacter sp. RM16192]|uniref:RNA polymerase factor sigma-54 n=1 Tax=Campylobacter sp. RM16192 TaxID=1660080 RepID=UPI0014524D3D|nr:RNA polymerase factor sigma-54 [Campylobacter sp. RM16192]QCD52688.1 RNA polymerase sigma54 factor [Campylobacter sp. RM16192]
MLRQTESLALKGKLSATLRSWLPILSSSIEELKETLEPFVTDNPFVTIEHKNQSHSKKNYFNEISKNSVSDSIETYTIFKESLYDKLIPQIGKPLFPTKKSQDIAKKIVECLSEEGYFEWDDEVLAGFDRSDIESVRSRFAYLEPCGVGANDYKESFLFQLNEFEVDDELYESAKFVIENFENLDRITKINRYDEAIAIVRKFKNPPAIEYLSDQIAKIPDIFINSGSAGIEISINDEFYPEILLDTEGLDAKNEFVSSRIKEAKDLIDALDMRKATLRKIALMIVEYQYDYFFGGDMKPMKLKDIADDLGRNPSTISRAISNKYLQCSRGLIPIKSFFSAAIDEEVSNSTIKDFVADVVKNENPKKPLSDLKILELIQSKFGVTMVRRTITKYRKALNIGSSSERKRIYMMQG